MNNGFKKSGNWFQTQSLRNAIENQVHVAGIGPIRKKKLKFPTYKKNGKYCVDKDETEEKCNKPLLTLFIKKINELKKNFSDEVIKSQL